MESKIEKLRIDVAEPQKPKSNSGSGKVDEVFDSWEDDELSSPSNSDVNTPIEAPGPSLKPVTSSDSALHPPPPTPISPKNGDGYVDWSPATVLGGGRPQSYSSSPSSTPRSPLDSDQEKRRPEKTTAAAGRMIAASLGIKAPKKTEEQRQYDRSIKEQEIKRQNRTKEEQERQRQEDEKAKAAMWDG